MVNIVNGIIPNFFSKYFIGSNSFYNDLWFSWHYYKKLFLNYRNNIVFKMCLL